MYIKCEQNTNFVIQKTLNLLNHNVTYTGKKKRLRNSN